MKNSENRLAQIFAELQKNGDCRTRKDFAQMLEVNYNGLISAMNGDPKFYTPSLIAKAERLVRKNATAPAAPAAPDVVIPGATAQMYADMARSLEAHAQIIKSQQETIALLASQLAGVAVSGGVFSGNVGARTDQAK